MADEIDYRILGEDLQAVVITLDPGEAVVAGRPAAHLRGADRVVKHVAGMGKTSLRYHGSKNDNLTSTLMPNPPFGGCRPSSNVACF